MANTSTRQQTKVVTATEVPFAEEQATPQEVERPNVAPRNGRSRQAQQTAEVLKEGDPTPQQVAARPRPAQAAPQVIIAPISTSAESRALTQHWDEEVTSTVFDTSWPKDAIQVVHKGEANYPAKLNSLNMPPEAIYYLGDLSILDTPTVAINMTRFTRTPEREQVRTKWSDERKAIHNAQYEAYRRGLARSFQAAGYLSYRGKTVIISTIREADMAIMKGVIKQDGKLIIVLPSTITHSELIDSVREFRDYIDNGQMLFISQFNEEATWNSEEAMERHVVLAALADQGLIIKCTSTKAGTGALVTALKTQGKPVFVLTQKRPATDDEKRIDAKRKEDEKVVDVDGYTDDTDAAAYTLINVYQCTQLPDRRTYAEALEPLVEDEDEDEEEANSEEKVSY